MCVVVCVGVHCTYPAVCEVLCWLASGGGIFGHTYAYMFMCGLSVDAFMPLFMSCFEIEQSLNYVVDNIHYIAAVSSLCPPDCNVHGQDGGKKSKVTIYP